MARVPHPKAVHAAITYREPLSVRLGRYLMTGGLVLGLLVVLYVLAWFVTSMSLRSGLQEWFAAREADGYVASYDEKKARIGGFPFSVRASLFDVHLGAPKGKEGKHAWVWSPEKVDFRITPLPWSVGTLHVDVETKQTLKVGRNSFEGKAKEFSLSFDWTSKGVPDDLSLQIKDGLFQDMNRHQIFKSKNLSVKMERLKNGHYVYDINAEDFGLPVGISGMGRNISELIVRGELNEHFGVAGMGVDDLALWRDNGGILETKRVQIAYGPLLLQGNGTLALDADLQLVGAFSARIQGFFKTVDRLRKSGVVRGPDASMAKVVLGMLSKQPSNGGPATISLPLTIQERSLFAGPVRLIAMPEIHW